MARASFRFVTDRTVEIGTKRLLARAALKQSQDTLAYLHRGLSPLTQALHFLRRVAEVESNLLQSGLLVEEEASREDLSQALEAVRLLEAATAVVGRLRSRKLNEAVALEEALDPIFFPDTKRIRLSPRGKGVPPGPPPVMEVGAAVPDPPTPAPIRLNLDPKLLEKARREIAAKPPKQEL